MKINIVRPTDGWVLQRIAESWRIDGATVSTRPDSNADCNVWVNYALFGSVGKHQKTRCDVGYFTHREGGNLGELFDRVASEVDWCIAMCDKTAAMLPPEKATVIHAAPHRQFGKHSIVLGIVGRDYPRKRNHLQQQVGTVSRVEVKFTGGHLDFSELPAFYRSLDYVLVLCDNECGPMCVPEALALGKPVIAPDVGWCWDYPVIRYSTDDELMAILHGLTPPTNLEESQKIYEVCRYACDNRNG